MSKRQAFPGARAAREFVYRVWSGGPLEGLLCGCLCVLHCQECGEPEAG